MRKVIIAGALLTASALLHGGSAEAALAEAPESRQPVGPAFTRWIYEWSRYPYLADCVSNLESRHGLYMYNPVAHGAMSEHAQGYFGWLPSTARTVGLPAGLIGDFEAEIVAFDVMMDRGRGGEFYGIGGYTGRYGTGPCFR